MRDRSGKAETLQAAISAAAVEDLQRIGLIEAEKGRMFTARHQYKKVKKFKK